MTTVTYNSQSIDMAAARMLMDDGICDAIHSTVDSEQDFMDAYAVAHLAKYQTPFVFN